MDKEIRRASLVNTSAPLALRVLDGIPNVTPLLVSNTTVAIAGELEKWINGAQNAIGIAEIKETIDLFRESHDTFGPHENVHTNVGESNPETDDLENLKNLHDAKDSKLQASGKQLKKVEFIAKEKKIDPIQYIKRIYSSNNSRNEASLVIDELQKMAKKGD